MQAKRIDIKQLVQDQEYLDLQKQQMKQSLEQGKVVNATTMKLLNQSMRYRTIGFWISIFLFAFVFVLMFIEIMFMLQMVFK